MKGFLLLLLCLSLIGCTTISKAKKLEKQVTELQETLLKRDAEIKVKDEKAKAAENQLDEKDQEIKRLRKQLESFGVYP